MTKDFAMTAVLPPYEDMVALLLIKNCFGSECLSYMEAEVAYMTVATGWPAILLPKEKHRQKQNCHGESHHTIHHHWLGFLDEAPYVGAFGLGHPE
jgi:hypothetical protein